MSYKFCLFTKTVLEKLELNVGTSSMIFNDKYKTTIIIQFKVMDSLRLHTKQNYYTFVHTEVQDG